MFDRILVAYNESPESLAAMDACARMVELGHPTVHLAGVIHLGTYLLAGEHICETVLSSEKTRMEASLQEQAKRLAALGAQVHQHLEVGEPIDVIEQLVTRLKIQLVIVGHARNKPLSLRWWRGTADATLVEKLHCHILVAADQPV